MALPKVPPTDYAKTPQTVTIEDWSSGVKGAEYVITFNDRRADWTFNHSFLSGDAGASLVKFSTQSVVLGHMEFGAIMWGSDAQTNAEANVPVYRVLILLQPTQANWSGYPAVAGYVVGATDTFPTAFKAVIRAIDGTILHTHEMRDGLPINDASLPQDTALYQTHAIRPFIHCASALPWWSHESKLNSNKNVLFPGAVEDSFDPKIARTHFGTNPPMVAFRFNDQLNGVSSFHSMPKWSLYDNAGVLGAMADSSQDPWLFDIRGKYNPFGDTTFGLNGAVGWGYEPGSYSGHDQLTGPGGIRQDRSFMPMVYSIALTKPDYVVPFDQSTIAERVEAWRKSEYNLPNFFITNVKTGATIPMEEVFANEWAHGKAYYGPNLSYTAGGAAKSIPLFALYASQGRAPGPFWGAFVDKNQRLPWNGAAPDYLHGSWGFGQQAMFWNDPMAAYATKHSYIMSILSQQSYVSDTANPRDWFMIRQHAWRWKHHVEAWMASSPHPDLGISKAAVEQRFINELTAIHDFIYYPAMVQNSQDDYLRCLKFIGLPISYISTPRAGTHSMVYYINQVLYTMKATGLWDILWNYSDKCQNSLKFIIRCLDLYAVDWILDTKGINEDYIFPYVGSGSASPLDLVTSWADYTARKEPIQGLADWTTLPDGTKQRDVGGNRLGSQHLRYQYVRMRIDYFSEIPCERTNGLALAAAEYERHYADMRTRCANLDRGTNVETNWAYYTPNLAAFNSGALDGGTLEPIVTGVTVTPATATGSTQFSASVQGDNNPAQGVDWSKTGGGTLSNSGAFVEPAKTSAIQTIMITATSQQDPNYSGTAAVTIPALVVTPPDEPPDEPIDPGTPQVANRFARPASDITPGLWEPSSGTSLFEMLNEANLDLTDFIQTYNPTACEIALGHVADPGTSSNQAVRYEAHAPDGGNLTVVLRQGETVIATRTHSALPVLPTVHELILTPDQCDAITDYGDLRVELVVV